MNGLDLFSGIGGITEALAPWVKPIAYCEIERYSIGALLSRQIKGELPIAPIWDDVTTLRREHIPFPVDIIYGGFPCQDISVAGRGAGLAGKRSGLFFEIIRLTRELGPQFVFLENVAAITVRGAERVVGEFCQIGYDARWGVLSAADVGANHRRERWWLLAHARHGSGRNLGPAEAGKDAPQVGGGDHDALGGSGQQPEDVAYADRVWKSPTAEGRNVARDRIIDGGKDVANTNSARRPRTRIKSGGSKPSGENVPDATDNGTGRRIEQPEGGEGARDVADTNHQGQKLRCSGPHGRPVAEFNASWWQSEPNVDRVANGVPMRVDRLRCLGNAVVPAQAREAFRRLSGL